MKSLPLRFLFIVIVAHLVLPLTPMIAQTQYRFRNYTTNDGLASSDPAIISDSLGFIWFVNSNSIQRFDGYTFKTYQHNASDSLLQLGPMLWYSTPHLDRSGNLWVSTGERGLCILLQFDSKLDGFIRHKVDLTRDKFRCLSFERDGDLVWIGGIGNGLFSYHPRSRKTKQYFAPYSDSLLQHKNNVITSIWDRGHYLLLTTQNGLWKFDKRLETFQRPKCDSKDSTLLLSAWATFASVPNSLNSMWIRIGNRKTFLKLDSSLSTIDRFTLGPEFNYDWYSDCNESRSANLWFGTHDKGLYWYDTKNKTFSNIRNSATQPLSLFTNYTMGVDEDRNGNLWVASTKGVSQSLHASLTIYNSPRSTPPEIVWLTDDQIIYGSQGKLWTAPLSLKDSIRFDPFNDMSPFDKPLLLFGNLEAPQFFYNSWKGKRNFWITSSRDGVLSLPLEKTAGNTGDNSVVNFSHDPENQNTINSNYACAIWEDDDQNVWVGTSNCLNKINLRLKYGEPGSVIRYMSNTNDPASLADGTVRGLVPEDDKSIWVATDGGLDLFHDGQFEHVFDNGEHVRTVYKAKDGTVFLGTANGLYEGIRSHGKYTFVKSDIVTQSLGLSNAIAEDKQGRLWISTSVGTIICLDRKRQIALKLSAEDGLLGSPVMPAGAGAPRILVAASGLMAIAFDTGFSLFDPETLVATGRKTSPRLTKLLVNNKSPVVGPGRAAAENFVMPVDIGEAVDLVIDYKHNNFSIEFAAMELINPERNLYRHRLEGYDMEWIQTDWKERTATYTNLDPGTYTFRVKASNYQGIWSENEKTLSIVVLPPPWKTWWAYTGYSLLAVALLLFARRIIVQRERLKSNLQLAIVEQEKEHFELEKAKEVDRVKTSFFTNISHEFRTPLTLIKGPVETLIEKFKDDPEAVKRLNLVRRNSELLLRLINQLLDLAKLESGTLRVEKSEGNPLSFIRAISSSFESFARQKGVSLVVEVPDKSLSANFDKDKVETIIINLINNAIKFTPPNGTVTVSAEVYFYDLVLVIKDTGIGIPRSHQEKIFERFHQVSEAHKEVGTGIGLSLVKELVLLMKGQITVTSEEGAGSEFMVTLPIEVLSGDSSTMAPSLNNGSLHHTPPITDHRIPVTDYRKPGHPETTASPGTPISEDESGKPHILVVEDNADLRAFIIDSLGTEFLFVEAADGKQGLEAATASVPDLIISDVMMPEMDGVEMTQKIKNDIRTSHIPVILLTAKSGEDSKLTGLQSGAEDYLTKPFNKQELLLKVRNRISLQLKLREKLRLELMKEAPAVNVQSADEKFLLRIKEVIHERMSDEQLSVESMADEIGISRSQLYRKVTALTGLSMNELIRNFRLKRASQLLQQNWGPVSQVAYEVGFSNLSYFSKVFKEEYGVLPSEYEKS
jgi:signal transduction histidine kinase/CheY-like chemotaxis protein/AraC-like DNA-binding protein/ligand-binding sensor domain-containing protein